MKKFFFFLFSAFFSAVFLFQSFVAMAESDPYEPPELFCGYRVLGHDMQGLPILSSGDYEKYFNECMQKKIFSQSSGSGMDTPSYDGQPQMDTPAAASAFDGLFETLTKLTKLIPPVDFSSSLGLHIGDFFGLDTSLHLGIGGSDTTEPSGGETEPQKNPSEIIISENLYSIGKKRIYYTAADTWEDIQCVVSIQPDRNYGSLSFARSGFGASSTFAIEIGNDDNDNVRVDWGSSGYTVASISGTLYSRGSSSHISNRRVTMRAFSINSLPITETSSKTLLSDTNYQIIGTMQQTSQCIYAESVFTTNSREYNANHYLIWNSGDYFEDFSVYLPDILTFSGGDVSFSGGDTVINNNNVNNYNDYGYYDDGDGGIAFDPDIFAAYIDKLLDHLIELYMQFYNQFPLPDEDIDDPDIQYVVPWELPTLTLVEILSPTVAAAVA